MDLEICITEMENISLNQIIKTIKSYYKTFWGENQPMFIITAMNKKLSFQNVKYASIQY